MKKFKLIATALLASTMTLMVGCSSDETAETVSSIGIRNKSDLKSIYVGLEKEIKFNVTVENGAKKTVEITSSNDEVLSIKKSGTKYYAKGLKEGTATITVKSTVDGSKSDSVEVTVVDGGFDPSLIEAGYTYMKEFPTDEIEEFLGEGEYEIIEPNSMDGGCYYMFYEDDGEYPAQAIVVLDKLLGQDYATQLVLDEGFDQYCVDSYGDLEIVDPTKTYTVSVSIGYDENYEAVGPSSLFFFDNDDVWESSEKTSDSAWNKSLYEEFVEYFGCVDIERIVDEIPFVALGKNYAIEPYLYYGMMAVPNTAMIYDYSVDNSMLDGYKDILLGDGFEEVENEDDYGDTYYTYEKAFGEDGILSIDFYWGEMGNTIDAMIYGKELDAYPSEKVASFVSNKVESKYSVPAFTGTAESYSFLVSPYAIFDEKTYEITGTAEHAEVEVLGTKKSSFDAYIQSLKDAGFAVEENDEYYAEYGEIEVTAEKGKISLDILYYAAETARGYSSINGDFNITIEANPAGVEE